MNSTDKKLEFQNKAARDYEYADWFQIDNTDREPSEKNEHKVLVLESALRYSVSELTTLKEELERVKLENAEYSVAKHKVWGRLKVEQDAHEDTKKKLESLHSEIAKLKSPHYQMAFKRVEELKAEIVIKDEALIKIIEMNRQNAEDEYGDADKAESWACVKVSRSALSPKQEGK